MSKAKEQNDRRPEDKRAGPTRSFDSSVPGPGSQIGPFRIEQELGRGGAGIVYLAHDTKLDRSVAIKSVSADLADDPAAQSRFLREAKLLASLNHPNIATIHEELEEAEGAVYLVLEYVPGQTLSEQIAKSKLELKEALSIACEIAEAISYAHNKGVIHRDLKPANIKITPEGRIKVLDLGIAKMIGAPSAAAVTITEPGQVIGTPGYMSPEQVRGNPADQRTDIWSFGCILYEMLAGSCPFSGQTASEALASILKTDPDWEALSAEASPDILKIIHKCLQKDPEQRYQSANELCEDLCKSKESLIVLPPKPVNIRALWVLLKRPKTEVAVALFLLVLCLITYGIIRHIKNTRWAIGAIPDIIKLIEADQYLTAFQLAEKVEKYIPNNSTLKELWPEMAREFSVITNPPGAEIYFRDYGDINGAPLFLGVSPMEMIRFPYGIYRWEIRKQDFDSRECLRSTFENDSSKLEITLLKKDLHREMLLIQSRTYGDYLIDKYEVTNRQFKEFVDHGGYKDPNYWRHKFVDEDGRILGFEEAMDRFQDQTNLRGPATWEGGTYPKGKDDYPVGGVSWYEAGAYAEFVGKILPPLDLWNRAAIAEWAHVVLPLSNFSGELAYVGCYKGISAYGAYDMAGNVREWCVNAPDEGERSRYIRGGACNDPDYMFVRWDLQSPWKRYPENGFRCVQYLDGQKSPPAYLLSPKQLPYWIRTGYPTNFVPKSRAVIDAYIEEFRYDPLPLNTRKLGQQDTRYWRKEKVVYSAAYNNEEIIAYLFLPKNAKPIYQPVVYFPGSSAQDMTTSDTLRDTGPIGFIIKSGRALLYPVYKGTYERRFTEKQEPETPRARRDWIRQLAKDVGRSIDYLANRGDMNMEKLTFYGLSWGACQGPVYLVAEEERIKYGMLFAGGLISDGVFDPSVNPIDYLAHVQVPILMINGDQDAIFPIETSSKAMYDLLGSEDKQFRTYDGGHSLFGLVSSEVKDDVLKWMDKHLGRVD
ncbi:MAG: protein kinase [Phycisphaerales bacterium]|nr:MAG: protein kinase [Phycisphaerales bacterium]